MNEKNSGQHQVAQRDEQKGSPEKSSFKDTLAILALTGTKFGLATACLHEAAAGRPEFMLLAAGSLVAPEAAEYTFRKAGQLGQALRSSMTGLPSAVTGGGLYVLGVTGRFMGDMAVGGVNAIANRALPKIESANQGLSDAFTNLKKGMKDQARNVAKTLPVVGPVIERSERAMLQAQAAERVKTDEILQLRAKVQQQDRLIAAYETAAANMNRIGFNPDVLAQIKDEVATGSRSEINADLMNGLLGARQEARTKPTPVVRPPGVEAQRLSPRLPHKTPARTVPADLTAVRGLRQPNQPR